MGDTAPWLLREVARHQGKSVGALARELGIDQNTIRRALQELKRGAVVRSRRLDKAPSPPRRGGRQRP